MCTLNCQTTPFTHLSRSPRVCSKFLVLTLLLFCQAADCIHWRQEYLPLERLLLRYTHLPRCCTAVCTSASDVSYHNHCGYANTHRCHWSSVSQGENSQIQVDSTLDCTLVWSTHQSIRLRAPTAHVWARTREPLQCHSAQLCRTRTAYAHACQTL